MTDEERRLLIVVAQAVIQSAQWGQSVGISHAQRSELSSAMEAFRVTQQSNR